MSTLRSFAWSSALVLFALIVYSSAQNSQTSFANTSDQAAAAAKSTLPPPVHLTSEQDHQRMMDLLHIKSIRRGADGSPNAKYPANYDESKANPYPNLPDPLLLNNGKKVKTAKVWWTKRRPQIKEYFDRDIYGRVPAHTPKVNWEVVSTTKEMNGDVPVITKKLVGHVDNSSYPAIKVDISLSVSTPANAGGPVPVIMEFGLSPEIIAAFRKRFSAQQMAALTGSGPSWQSQVLAKGWGYAELIPTTVQADNGAGLTEGIIGLCNKGQPRKPDDWGALRAWAWGASRALDYFETDKDVDAKQVGLEGHSRYGKATLVAMAYDQRFAIAYVSSSGEGGAKLYRRNFGEQMGNVAGTGEYHWMAGNFIKYDGPLSEKDLPVDAHELIAMCAPRPVFISGGSAAKGDGWVDAKGMFMAAAAAGPVYKLLGKTDMGTTVFPPMLTPLIDGDIAFRQHDQGHTPGPNWPFFIEFASRYLKAPPENGDMKNLSKAGDPPAPEVALTFDDLPVHGPLPQGVTREDIANRIIHALQAANVPPTYGFVNAQRIQEDASTEQVLQLWRNAGFPLGNHTFSHMDLNSNTTKAFEQDLEADEPILKKYMDHHDFRWLRFPYLHEGANPQQHKAIEDYLKAHGYKVAEVTLSFGDYLYNEPYARCVAKNDTQAIDWMKKSYLDGSILDLDHAEQVSKLIYGRDIKHVMLLHIGGFDAVMISSLIDTLKQHGVKLISLQEAASDPAYAVTPELQVWQGTFLQQMLASRHLTPPPGGAPNPTPKLNALCR